MRNLKKILALVLALVMSMSLLATANAFEDDEDIDADFNEAIVVLSELGVFQGYDNGETFQPKGNITRAEVAAIIYRIVTGDVEDKQTDIYDDYNKFDDVKSDKWYAGYVNFCANAEIIKGYSATEFGPNDTVTGYQALAMILRAIGYDKNGEFTGAGWQVQTAAVAKKLGITNNIAAGTLGTPATREMVAEILFQTILVPQVNYTLAFGYSDFGMISLGYETFKLFEAQGEDDVWGRPSKVWYLDLNANKKIDVKDDDLVALPYAPVVSYETPVTECQIAADTAQTKREVTYTTYINGKVNAGKQVINSLDTKGTAHTAQGRQTLVYTDRIVYIDTLLAAVTDVTEVKYDAAGHIRNYAALYLDVYYGNAENGDVQIEPIVLYSETDWSYTVGEYLLVNAVQNDVTNKPYDEDEAAHHVEIVGIADSMVGGQTKIWKNVAQHTVEGETYNDNNRFHLDMADIATTDHTWFFDQFGNLIGAVDINTEYDYGVINSMYWDNDHGVGTPYVTIAYMDGTISDPIVLASLSNFDANAEDDYYTLKPTYAQIGNAGYTDGEYLYLATYAKNNAYMAGNDLYRIETNAKGAVNLVECPSETLNATIEAKYSVIMGTASKDGKAVIKTNSATQYLVRNADNTYTAITGYNNIYDYSKGAAKAVDAVYLNNDAYAEYVYIQGTPDSAYASSLVLVEAATYYWDAENEYYVVYITLVDGEETTVMTEDFEVVKKLVYGESQLFYVDYTDGFAVKAEPITNHPFKFGADMRAVMVTDAILTADDIQATVAGNIIANFNVTTAEKIVGELEANMTDKIVYIVYRAVGTHNYVEEIYVLDNYIETPDTPEETKGAVEYKVVVIDQYGNTKNVITAATQTKVEAKEYTTSYAALKAAMAGTTANWTNEPGALALLNALTGTAEDVTFTVKAGETTTATFVLNVTIAD